MNKFKDKTLLILGSNVGTIDIINYAKKNGAKIVVTDYYDPKDSPGKLVSDYHEKISTDDINGLLDLCEKYKVDGIISGISEFNLLQAKKVCNLLKKPIYFSDQQWNLISHKDSFRKLCEEFNVSCPKTYFLGPISNFISLKNIEYPIVIKPVDGSMSQGVTICSCEDKLQEALQEADKFSDSNRIIIEEFFEGDEFTAHYSIVNGKVNLACMDNRYPVSVNRGSVTTIPIARVFPSTFLSKYLEKENQNVIKMIESINLKSGILFLQGFYNKEKDKFCIFEAGLRCAGEAPYRFIEKVNGLNFLNPIVDLSLETPTKDYDFSKENPYLNGKYCGVISLVTKGGKVSKIEGLEESVSNVKSVIEYECRYKEGEETPSGNTLRQLMIRFVMICDSIDQMKSDINYLNSNINVYNDKGKSMVLKFDEERLSKEFIVWNN